MMPYIVGMAKTARLEFRVEPALKARLEAEADRRGQKLTTFVERALESALSRGGEAPGLAGSVTSQSPAAVEEKVSRQRHQATQSRTSAPCPECGSNPPLHQRGCSKAK